jgi:U2-associated protein SR140
MGGAGDTLRTWREEPFVLLAHGPRWLPPAMPSATVTPKTAAQRGGEGKVSPQPWIP